MKYDTIFGPFDRLEKLNACPGGDCNLRLIPFFEEIEICGQTACAISRNRGLTSISIKEPDLEISSRLTRPIEQEFNPIRTHAKMAITYFTHQALHPGFDLAQLPFPHDQEIIAERMELVEMH